MRDKWEEVCKALCLVLKSSIKGNCYHYWSSDNLAHWFLANLTLRIILQIPTYKFPGSHSRYKWCIYTPAVTSNRLILRILLLQTLYQIIYLVCCVHEKIPLQKIDLMEWTHQVKILSAFPPNFRFCPPWVYIPLVPACIPSFPCCGHSCPQQYALEQCIVGTGLSGFSHYPIPLKK